jgi:hypothetical protein
MATKARPWANGNKLAPQKANSRRKNVQTCFRTVLWPVLARGRPWAARFVHLSRELAVQRWHMSCGPTDEHCPGAIYQGNGSHEIPRLRPTAPGTWPWGTSAPAFENFRNMPATGPRVDRSRANAGETAECIDLAASGLAPSYLASPGDCRCRI